MLYLIDSIAGSVYIFIFVELTESETNPNNNLMMRRAGLSNIKKLKNLVYLIFLRTLKFKGVELH